MVAKKRKSFLSKVLKGLGVFVVVIVLLVVGAIVWINPIVKNAVNVGGPVMLGVPVSVGDVSIKPLSGVIDLKKFYIGNPENYSADRALFTVDSVHVAIDMKSLFGNVITIHKIQIDKPQISYEVKGKKSNFDVLVENLGETEKKKKDKKDKKAGEDKKVIIEEFELNSTQVSYTSPVTFNKVVTVPFPSLKLRDIGKSEGGVSTAQATMDILRSFISDFGRMAVDVGKAVGEGVKDAAKAVGNGTKDAAKDATKAIKKLF